MLIKIRENKFIEYYRKTFRALKVNYALIKTM